MIPQPEKDLFQCRPDEEFKHCGSICYPSCNFNFDGRKDNILCEKRCVRGCFCKKGLVRMGSYCVTPDECPCKNNKNPQSQVKLQ